MHKYILFMNMFLNIYRQFIITNPRYTTMWAIHTASDQSEMVFNSNVIYIAVGATE